LIPAWAQDPEKSGWWVRGEQEATTTRLSLCFLMAFWISAMPDSEQV
jgi:hypothetical protein